MKTIGIIGGIGWRGSATYYRVMNQEVQLRLGGHHSARIILDSLEFSQIALAQERDDFEKIRVLLVESAIRLQNAGADVLVIACNTVHRFAQSVVDVTTIPLLHIADVAGQSLVRDGHRKVGLLGTQATMQSAFYKKRLATQFGLDVIIPEKVVRGEIHSMILDKLACGRELESCASELDSIMDGFADNGATAVLLACTEFGLAFGSRDKRVTERTLPAYDTAILHAHQAIDFALA